MVPKPPTEDIWEFFSEAIDLCGAILLKHVLHAKYLVNSDDIKILVLPTNENDTCTSVTIGIGNDTAAEKKLKDYVPNTSFYGADPILESGKIFKEIGNYYQAAVSSEGGQYNASVLKNGKYSWEMVPTSTLADLLSETMKLTNIDFLLLDVEGAEYNLLPQFVKHGPLEERKLTICQVNVELHGPLLNYGTDGVHFSRVLKQFLLDSPFIPLWGHKPLKHQPVFLINWRDPYCVQKFLNHWC